MHSSFPLLILLPWFLYGQSPENLTPCAGATAQATLHGNNIAALFLNGGDLFWDFNRGQFVPNPTGGNDDPSSLFAAALWLGAHNAEPPYQPKVAAQMYRQSGRHDYWPGPLSRDGFSSAEVCAAWDWIFKVSGSDVAAFLASPPLEPAVALAEFPGIMGWPAVGNPFFETVNGFPLPVNAETLAPFYDAGGDGQYNPLDGDYPAIDAPGQPGIVPAEILWTVFNDVGIGQPHQISEAEPLYVEVQLTAWAFDCPDDPVLQNTVFTRHMIINRGATPLDSLFAGLWVDPDLGCPYDDHIGSKPSLHTFFSYNNDAVDGMPGNICGTSETFDGDVPTQSVTLLSASLDRFIYYNSAAYGTPIPATIDPETPQQFYRLLNGRWLDGSPIEAGGTGYDPAGTSPVDHVFSGDPADPAGWSQCTFDLGVGERMVVGSHHVGTLLPKQAFDLVAAWTHHPQPGYTPCQLGNMFAEIESLHDHYGQGFAAVCSPLSAAPEVVRDAFALLPNPAGDAVTVQYGAHHMRELRLFNAEGRLVRVERALPAGETRLELNGLPAGVYLVQLLTADALLTGRLAVR
jgi:hypothetical protein